VETPTSSGSSSAKKRKQSAGLNVETWDVALKKQEKRRVMEKDSSLNHIKQVQPLNSQESPLLERIIAKKRKLGEEMTATNSIDSDQQQQKQLKRDDSPTSKQPTIYNDSNIFEGNSPSKSPDNSIVNMTKDSPKKINEKYSAEISPIQKEAEDIGNNSLDGNSDKIQSNQLDSNGEQQQQQNEEEMVDIAEENDQTAKMVYTILDLIGKKVPPVKGVNPKLLVAKAKRPKLNNPQAKIRRQQLENEELSPIKTDKNTLKGDFPSDLTKDLFNNQSNQLVKKDSFEYSEENGDFDDYMEEDTWQHANSQVPVCVNLTEQKGRLKLMEKLNATVGSDPNKSQDSNKNNTEQEKSNEISSPIRSPKSIPHPSPAKIPDFVNLEIDAGYSPEKNQDIKAISNGSKQKRDPKSFRILLSNVLSKDKKKYLDAIEKLNGKIEEEIGPDVTHVVTPMVTASLKCLGALVLGKWILKPSFLWKSVEQGEFVDEEEHEWKSEDLSEKDANNSKADYNGRLGVAKSARTCRLYHINNKNNKEGILSKFRAIFLVDQKAQLDSWRRIIELGGGTSYADLNEVKVLLFCNTNNLH
jgi:cell wall-associated NlpC family hydrolase